MIGKFTIITIHIERRLQSKLIHSLLGCKYYYTNTKGHLLSFVHAGEEDLSVCLLRYSSQIHHGQQPLCTLWSLAVKYGPRSLKKCHLGWTNHNRVEGGRCITLPPAPFVFCILHKDIQVAQRQTNTLKVSREEQQIKRLVKQRGFFNPMFYLVPPIWEDSVGYSSSHWHVPESHSIASLDDLRSVWLLFILQGSARHTHTLSENTSLTQDGLNRLVGFFSCRQTCSVWSPLHCCQRGTSLSFEFCVPHSVLRVSHCESASLKRRRELSNWVLSESLTDDSD